MTLKTTTKRITAARTANTNSMSIIFRSTVIAAFIANFVLSVDAIICHQCNSHMDEDCVSLRLSTPRAPRDNQYLRECEEHGNNSTAFCRKTAIIIESSDESRIVRSCGWIKDSVKNQDEDYCFSADNEGFKQEICACYEDGCNAATHQSPTSWMLSLAVMSMLVISWLCRSVVTN